VFDPASFAGNTVEFASLGGNQKIPAGVYQNISVLGGSPKLITNGDLQIEGELHLESNIERDPFSLDLAHIILNGTQDQIITGTGEGIIQAMDVEKDSGTVIVRDAFVIQETISLLKGEVRTENSFVGLSGFAVITETEKGYISGKLATTRNINGGSTNEFGGMGLKILAARDKPLGQTLVIRTTGSSVDPDHIQRYFEITPTFNEDLNAKVNFFYNERDLAGAKEKELVLVRDNNNGGAFEELDSKNFFKDNELVDFFIDEFGTIAARTKTLRVKAFPTPFQGTEAVTIAYFLPFDSPVTLSVYDRAGRLTYRDELEGLTGKNVAEIPGNNNRAGTYYVHIHTAEREGYAKIFKLAY
ncbi:MAG: T9SS type A sorting domain-containing protein, partial [Bacteroidota bacterium]